MRIRRVRVHRVRMRLRRPYAITYQEVSEAENLFLRLDTSDGRTGWGCAAPDPDVTGERVEDCLARLEGEVAGFLRGKDAGRIAWLEAELERVAPRAPAARAAASMALHDLLGQRAGLPLYKILGWYRPRIVTSVTIGICGIEDTVAQAREHRRAGFRVVKIKGGRSRAEDVERVEAVLRRVRGLTIRFDANQGYSVRDARAFLLALGRKVEILEQPTRAEHLGDLKRVSALSPIPVMADESIHSLLDSFRIATGDMADMINLKLMKTGGLRMAAKANAVAEAGRMETMIGCMDESRLAIAAGVHFALSHRNVEYADLDGHLDLRGDPARGGPVIEDGCIRVVDRPGLGVAVGL